MLDTNKLPDGLLQNIASNMGWEEGQSIEPYKARIADLDTAQAFDKFCDWYGFIGYGPVLRWAMTELQKATN